MQKLKKKTTGITESPKFRIDKYGKFLPKAADNCKVDSRAAVVTKFRLASTILYRVLYEVYRNAYFIVKQSKKVTFHVTLYGTATYGK